MMKLLTTLFKDWQQVLAATVLAVVFMAATAFLSPIYYHASFESITQVPHGWVAPAVQTILSSTVDEPNRW